MESRPHHPRPRPDHSRPRPPLPRSRPLKSETETQCFSCQIFVYTKNIIFSLGIFFYTKNIIFSLEDIGIYHRPSAFLPLQVLWSRARPRSLNLKTEMRLRPLRGETETRQRPIKSGLETSVTGMNICTA